jgi:hypothetical protein
MGPNGIRKMLEDAENDYSNNSNNQNNSSGNSNDDDSNNNNNNSENVSNINNRNNEGIKNGNITDNANVTVILKKPPQKAKIKRVSYYLKISTIKFIEDLAKQRGTGISETLQDLMDELQGKIKIE